jgi:hypothetical protein
MTEALKFFDRIVVDTAPLVPVSDTLLLLPFIQTVCMVVQGGKTPVIRGADGKRLRLISREVHDLAARARSRQLMPDDVVGGTFTITNPGPFGTFMTLPIINQPQVAVLLEVWHDASTTWWIIITGVAFGVAHLYQGPKGVVLTAGLGMVFGVVVATVGLVPAMVVHTLIDLRLLLVPPSFFELPREDEPESAIP